MDFVISADTSVEVVRRTVLVLAGMLVVVFLSNAGSVKDSIVVVSIIPVVTSVGCVPSVETLCIVVEASDSLAVVNDCIVDDCSISVDTSTGCATSVDACCVSAEVLASVVSVKTSDSVLGNCDIYCVEAIELCGLVIAASL